MSYEFIMFYLQSPKSVNRLLQKRDLQLFYINSSMCLLLASLWFWNSHAFEEATIFLPITVNHYVKI
jgi:hypothetical protein